MSVAFGSCLQEDLHCRGQFSQNLIQHGRGNHATFWPSLLCPARGITRLALLGQANSKCKEAAAAAAKEPKYSACLFFPPSLSLSVRGFCGVLNDTLQLVVAADGRTDADFADPPFPPLSVSVLEIPTRHPLPPSLPPSLAPRSRLSQASSICVFFFQVSRRSRSPPRWRTFLCRCRRRRLPRYRFCAPRKG